MKKIVMIMLIILVGATFSYASDLSSKIDDFINNATYFYDSPNTVQGQSSTFYTGGRFSYRTQSTQIGLGTITPPSVKAGCNGIDITFGAFKYFDPQRYIEFAEKIIAQAPALAFNQALHVLCPSCEAIMNKLNSIANMINNMNLDSCATSQALVKSGFDAVGLTANKVASDISDPREDSWLTSFETNVVKPFTEIVPDWVNDWATGKDKPSAFMSSEANKSFLAYAIRNHQQFNVGNGDGNEFIQLIRYYTGDIIRESEANGSNPPSFTYLGPIGHSYQSTLNSRGIKTTTIINDDTLLDRIAGGDSSGCKSSIVADGMDENGNTVSITITPVCNIIKDAVESIIDKFENRTSLSDSELHLLGQYRIPMYKILNYLSVSPDAISELNGPMQNVMASELLSNAFEDFLKEIKPVLAQLAKAQDKKEAIFIGQEYQKIFIGDLDHFRTALKKKTDTSYIKFLNSIEQVKKMQELQNALKVQLMRHPIGSSYVFGKAIPGFR